MIKSHTLNEIYKDITRQFSLAEVNSPKLDAKLLICAALSLSESDFMVRRSDVLEIDLAKQKTLEGYIKRRLDREPVSKILGQKGFWTHDFHVTHDVLDPRPDSETLIETVLDFIDSNLDRERPLRILELGVGSGALICTLLAECKNAVGQGTDISRAALDVAKQNAVNIGVAERLTLIEGSWLDPVLQGKGLEAFDIVLSNPPYIPSSDIESLSVDVKKYDPILALDGGEDGLNPYREILSNVDKVIHPHGRIFFEFGTNQKGDLSRIVEDYGFAILETRQDLSGKDRVVSIAYGEK
jgi:release factor glutamine methyltransferase